MFCVRVVFRCLVFYKYIVNIVEECIYVYFKGGKEVYSDDLFNICKIVDYLM